MGAGFDTNYRKICVTTQVDFGRKYACRCLAIYVGLAEGKFSFATKVAFSIIQGLLSKFQMTGANHHLMTLIQSKTVKFIFSLKLVGKLTGAMGFSENRRMHAPVKPALTEPLSYEK